MTYTAQIIADQPAGVCLLDAPKFDRFRDPACAAALWQRHIPPDVLSWIADLDPEVLPNARMVLDASLVRDAVDRLFNETGIPKGLERDWLVNDIAALARLFVTLMQAPYVRLRLQAVTTNACRKFHLDALTGRLVCTYRGTGTQYGTSRDGDDPEQVFTTPTGAPILLRGSRWPSKPETGLLHRSPPIEATGETRLVLVLDPLYDQDGAE